MSRFVIVLSVIIYVVFAGCSDDEAVGPDVDDTDRTAPRMIDHSPGNGGTDVPVDAVVTVAFSEYVDTLSVNTNSFAVSSATGTVACWADSATFTPFPKFAYSTVCTVTVTTDVTDLAGNHLDQGYSWVFTTATEPIWSVGNPMPTGRLYLSAAVVDDVIYAIGGRIGAEYSTKVEAYEPTTDTWATRADMPTGREKFAVAVLSDSIYAIGGYGDSGRTNVVEVYDPLSNTWSTKAPLSYAPLNPRAAVVRGKLYCIGGNTGGSNYIDTVVEYDPGTNTWTPKAPMPSQRAHHGVVGIGNYIFAFGGYGTGSYFGYHTDMERYYTDGNSWDARSPAPTARADFATASIGNVIYVVGGFGGHSALNVNEAYNTSTDSWSTKTPMPSGRMACAGAAVGGKLYIIGGGQASQLVEIYNPSLDQ